jgi:hypothetical protein
VGFWVPDIPLTRNSGALVVIWIGAHLGRRVRHLLQRGVADSGALFVGGEEGGFLQARPEGFALGREGFDGV